MFEVLSFKVRVVQRPKGVIETEAILRVEVDGRIEAVAGEGNDIKDAFFEALCKVLLPVHPCLAELKILCCEIFNLKNDLEENSFVTALFVFSDGEETWADQRESVNVCEAVLGVLVAGFKRTIEKTG